MTISNDIEIIRASLPELDLPTDFEPAYPALKRIEERIELLNNTALHNADDLRAKDVRIAELEKAYNMLDKMYREVAEAIESLPKPPKE